MAQNRRGVPMCFQAYRGEEGARADIFKRKLPGGRSTLSWVCKGRRGFHVHSALEGEIAALPIIDEREDEGLALPQEGAGPPREDERVLREDVRLRQQGEGLCLEGEGLSLEGEELPLEDAQQPQKQECGASRRAVEQAEDLIQQTEEGSSNWKE